MHKTRPIRISITNAQGKKTTLNSGPASFRRLDTEGHCQEHIILGLGPMLDGEDLSLSLASPDLLNPEHKVYYLACSEFAKAIEQEGGQIKIPSHWQSISFTELLPLLQGRALWWYKQNMHFYPDFWANILGNVQAWLLRGKNTINHSKSVMVAGNEQLLLHKELCTAFAEHGFAVHSVYENMQNIIAKEQPSLFFSVNLRGLDGDGANFALLKALNIPVALWFVDNPWHILSSLRLAWWKQATLFVTDASFIPELKKHGAKNVYHLPLAASQHMWDAQKLPKTKASLAAEEAGCIFVGRASFPDNAGFFAAAQVEQTILDEALNALKNGTRPHFHWWQERLGVKLWPDHAVRAAGLGAEQCACAQRVMWLRELLAVNPVIFGDSEVWKGYLPMASAQTFYPALNYYSELARVYASAACVLNVTSLLLPAGLTQRHFDVWAAGGFLFTDITQGLEIFEKDLVQAISVESPSKLAQNIRNMKQAKRQELICAWQQHIASEHSYFKRVGFVLERVL